MTPPDHPLPLPDPDPDPPPPPADEVIELVAEPVPVVRPIRRRRPEPPQPGFWMAVAWCVGLLTSLYVPLVVAGGLTFAALALASGDAKVFWEAERQQVRKVAGAGPADPPGDPPSMPEGVSYSLAVGMAAGHVGSLTLALLLLRFGAGPDWKRKVALRRPPVVPLVLSLVVLPGLMLTHAAVHTGLNETAEAVVRLFDPKADTGSGAMDAQLKAMIAPWPVWLAVLLIGVGPGVIEEVFCRGYLGRGLVARYGPFGGVLLTSVLFGMLHLAPLYAVGTMVMGVFLHVTYLATRSLWVPVLLHFLNNTLTVLAVLNVPAVRGLQADPADVPAAAYLLGFALTGVGLWALWSGRGRLVSVDPGRPAWRPAFPGVELPPSDSGTVVRHRLPNPLAVALALAALGGLSYYLT